MVSMFLAHGIALSPPRIIFNEISTICKWGAYVETCFMRSNVKAVKIQCKRAPNTSSGKFQRGPAAVKISRYKHHSLGSLRNQQERWWGKDGDIYIMIKCLSVCLSRKMITSSWESPVTTWTPQNHAVQLQVSFDGSRLVFHGSMSVL